VTHRGYKQQKGAALLVFITIVILGAATLLVNQLGNVGSSYRQSTTSMQALAEAREALIGWSASHPSLPGLLPLPDLDNNGESDCVVGIGSNILIGRLPFAAPALPACGDAQNSLGVRATDASGEPLWYAVSRNLLYDGGYPTSLDATNDWITVRDSQGNIISDRVVAVIIAPGLALSGQNRSTNPLAANRYMDTVTIGAVTYSNFDLDREFIAAEQGDTFNDYLVYITIDELMLQAGRVMARRIGSDVRGCLDSDAAAGDGTYSWAARLNGALSPDYNDDVGENLGRLPDLPTSGGWTPANCFASLSYWQSWKEQLFYQVASGYQPGSVASCPTCLSLDGSGNKRAMLMLAGPPLAGQQRTTNADKGDISNYLEGDNGDGDNLFANQAYSASFNDRVLCVDGGVTCN